MDLVKRWDGQSQESARRKDVRVLMYFLIELINNGNFPAIAEDRAIWFLSISFYGENVNKEPRTVVCVNWELDNCPTYSGLFVT